MPSRKTSAASPSRKRLIQAEDLYRFQLLNEPRLSPDGEQVVYTVQRVERKTEKKYSNLWVVAVQGAQPRQFTWGDQNDDHPRWSPDGRQIAFLSNRGNNEKPAQIYLIPFGGGEARPLSNIPGSVGDFSWSPDGKTLLCSVLKTDAEVLEREKDEEKNKLGVVARHYERLFFKLDGFGYLPHERWHIWTVDVRTGRAKQLTDHAVFDEESPSWSPDGKWIAFVSNRSADPDSNPDGHGLYIMPAGGGDLRQIPAPPGAKSSPVFSPDGRWITWYAQEDSDKGYKNTGLWLASVDGSAAAHNLTEKYDLNVSSWTINDMGQPEMLPPVWSLDSSRLFFPVTLHGSSLLYSIAADGADLQTVLGEDGVAASYSFDRSQQRMAYFYGSLSDPCQVYVQERSSRRSRRLTSLNQDLLSALDLGQVETHWIKGPAGNDLQGWILKPPGFDPAQKYPSILEIHGGPMTQYGYFFMHEFYFLAAQGYVIHFCNPRGGRGYGEEHTRAIWGSWGSADYDDLMAWSDYVEKQPYIDAGRMGVTGGSYGGYMTVWIIGHTQRFKAAATQRCVSNFLSMWGSSDFNWLFQYELQAGPPFEDFDKYWERSPMKYIGSARTPTLVSHSENDHRCPIEQGEQVYVALKRLGVDTEMIRYPDEFHGLSRSGRTDRRIARLDAIAGWFKKHLG
jgi:dipeptidyl aminopeptidase/acylaminoacyl peptidase